MRPLRLAALVFTLAATSAFAADGHFDRTLSVSPGVSLAIGTGSGYIHVTPGNDNQIHISAQVHSSHGWGNGGGDVEGRIKQIIANPPIQQSGNMVTVGGHDHQDDLYRNITIDYEVQTPRSTVLHASSGSGDIQVEETGPNDSINTGSGSIRVNRMHGAATLQSGSGDIQLQQAGSGDVRAQTGSGSIRINGFSGGLRAQTGSGDIQIEGKNTGDWNLQTGSGSLRLGLGNDAHFILDADTGSGTIRVSQPIVMQGNIGRNHVHGSVNGGGASIKARTGSGDVEIH